MGNWHLSIQGVGCHHNGEGHEGRDMEHVARRVVEMIDGTGAQTITSATLTFGGADNVADVLGHISEAPGEAGVAPTSPRAHLGPEPGIGDVVDFIADNARMRGLVTARSPILAEVAVVGSDTLRSVDVSECVVVRRYNPDEWR